MPASGRLRKREAVEVALHLTAQIIDLSLLRDLSEALIVPEEHDVILPVVGEQNHLVGLLGNRLRNLRKARDRVGQNPVVEVFRVLPFSRLGDVTELDPACFVAKCGECLNHLEARIVLLQQLVCLALPIWVVLLQILHELCHDETRVQLVWSNVLGQFKVFLLENLDSEATFGEKQVLEGDQWQDTGDPFQTGLLLSLRSGKLPERMLETLEHDGGCQYNDGQVLFLFLFEYVS